MGCNSYEVEHRRNPYTEPAESIKEAVKEAMNVKWELNEDAMKRLKDLGEDTVRNLLGWKDVKKVSVTKDRLEAIEGKNLAVNRSVSALFELDNELQKRKEDYLSTDVYFDWFVAKSGRMMIDSAGVNIQSDKLHRFLFNTKKQTTNIDMNTEEGKKQLDVFKMAVAQSFGFAIDKKSTKKSIEFADKILSIKNLDQKIMSQLKKGNTEFTINDTHIEIEFLGQMLSALDEIKKYHGAKNGKFETKLVVETDALTSGFGLKMLQMPLVGDIGKVKSWLAKTGIIIGNDAKPDKGMNDISDPDTGFTDSYKTLAKGIGSSEQVVNAIGEALLETFGKEAKPTKAASTLAKSLGVNTNREGAEKAIRMLNSMKDILPVLVDENGEVTSDGRSLFKGPFMTFNYGAGWAKIKKELAFDMQEKVMQQILDYKIAKESNEKYDKNLDDMMKELGIESITSKELMENSLKDIKNKDGLNLKAMIGELLGASYGQRVKTVLEGEFASIIEANNAVNSTLKLMFRTFKLLMDKELNRRGWKEPTYEQELEVFKSLQDAFPIIRSPLGNGIKDGIAIFTTAMDYRRQERIPGTLLKTTDGKRSDTFKGTRSIRRYLEEAGAAGSVIPIHTLDASIMAKTMLGKDALEVHDALVLGIGQVEQATMQYNKELIDLSANWSMMDEVEKAYNRLENKYPSELNFIKNQEDNEKESEAVDILKNKTREARDIRTRLFSEPIQVQNMVFNKNSWYMREGIGLKSSAEQIIEAVQNKSMKVSIKNELGKIQKIIEGCK